MKDLAVFSSLAIIACSSIGCRNQEATAELEAFRSRAAVEQHNIELTRASVEHWYQGDYASWRDLLGPDFAFYYPSRSADGLSPEEKIKIGERILTAFPDVSYTVDDIFARGDKVVVRFTQRGTHKGEYQGAPPTGVKTESSAIIIARIKSGKIIELREEFDTMGMLQQIGMEVTPRE